MLKLNSNFTLSPQIIILFVFMWLHVSIFSVIQKDAVFAICITETDITFCSYSLYTLCCNVYNVLIVSSLDSAWPDAEFCMLTCVKYTHVTVLFSTQTGDPIIRYSSENMGNVGLYSDDFWLGVEEEVRGLVPGHPHPPTENNSDTIIRCS